MYTTASELLPVAVKELGYIRSTAEADVGDVLEGVAIDERRWIINDWVSDGYSGGDDARWDFGYDDTPSIVDEWDFDGLVEPIG